MGPSPNGEYDMLTLAVRRCPTTEAVEVVEEPSVSVVWWRQTVVGRAVGPVPYVRR